MLDVLKSQLAILLVGMCLFMTACKGNVATSGGGGTGGGGTGGGGQTAVGPMLISPSANGGIANGRSTGPAMSDDGRFVAFSSTATNLLAISTLGGPTLQSIYVRDTCRGGTADCASMTSLVAQAENGAVPNGPCGISADQPVSVSTEGRYYAFACTATNMVAGANNGHSQVFLRDSCLNGGASCVPHTILISQNINSTQGDQDSTEVAISPNGRFVAFTSLATNLVFTNIQPNVVHIYLRDTCNGLPANTGCAPQTVLISQNSAGIPANVNSLGGNDHPWVDNSGRFVVFDSPSTNLDPKATATLFQVYVRDTCGFPPTAVQGCTPSTRLAVVNNLGFEPNKPTSQAEISPDGRYIVFAGQATDLLNGGPVLNSKQQIFVRDTCFGALVACVPVNTLISIGIDDAAGNDDSLLPSINSTGRFIGWNSKGRNLAANATDNFADAFVRDTCLGVQGCTPTTVLISKTAQGQEANGDSGLAQSKVPLSSDGKVAAFASSSRNLAPNSTGSNDIFFTPTSF